MCVLLCRHVSAWHRDIASQPVAQGTLTVELYTQQAPRTCANFSGLARRRYYDGVAFHRIVPGFVIQGGDPTGTGRGGESVYGAPFEVSRVPRRTHMVPFGASCGV